MNPKNISIRIVSKRKERGAVNAVPGETIVHIDRTNPVLGNRHILASGRHEDMNERMRVIAAHKADFNADLARNGPISRELDRIAALAANGERFALMCWCAPRPCHGDHYREEIMRRATLICEAA